MKPRIRIRQRSRRARISFRSLILESLEDRRMMTVNWRNPVDALDVTSDGNTVPLDVLNIVNELNSRGSRKLADDKDPSRPYWDTNGDQFIAPLDALRVVNALNDGN